MSRYSVFKGVLCIAACFFGFISMAAEPVRISLPSEAVVHGRDVRLAAVADLSGSSGPVTRQIADLDLIRLTDGEKTTSVTKESVRLRLLLAGVDEAAFEITGAESTRLQLQERVPWTDARLETMLGTLVAERMDVPAEEVKLQLVGPFLAALPESQRSRPALRLEAIPNASLRTGRMAIVVRLWDGSQLIGARTALCEVSRRYQVAVASKRLQRQQILQSGDVRFEEKFLTQPVWTISPTGWEGKRLVRDLDAGDVVQEHLLTGGDVPKQQQAVRMRDSVQVIARSGNVRVTLQSGEALQGGDVGDVVLVRNRTSNAVMSGVIQANGQVEIVLE